MIRLSQFVRLRWIQVLGVLLGVSQVAGCAAEIERIPASKPTVRVEDDSRVVAARSTRNVSPIRIGARPPRDARGRTKVTVRFRGAPLAAALEQVCEAAGLQLLLDPKAADGLELTLAVDGQPVDQVLERIESAFPLTIERSGFVVVVSAAATPRLATLVYPVPGGLVPAALPQDFDSLHQLAFVSRMQQQDGGDEGQAEAAPFERLASHVESFLGQIERLVPWPDGASWYLDRRQGLLFVRAPEVTLDQVERCLDLICRDPIVVEIEARFLEVSEDRARELGVELGLNEDFPVHSDSEQVSVGSDSGTRVGIPALTDTSGGQLTILGLLSQPRFRAALRALETSGHAEVLSAPAISTINNSRATIAITTNLPYVEDYRPVLETDVVASDGISSTESSVALVAVINDRNFTGIVLNVTPSVGNAAERIHLRVQPVVRAQVGSITIADGAFLEGTQTPAITRPIIETRFLDTQLALEPGTTAVLGGLKNTVERRELTGVPILRSIPFLGWLFRRETTVKERRDLLIFVSARLRS